VPGSFCTIGARNLRLDRQHPGDLSDVKLLLGHEGKRPENIQLDALVSLVSHGRPVAEWLQPRMTDKELCAFQTVGRSTLGKTR